MENRKSWDSYFMDIAKMVATRSTCPRLSVGSVLVRDKKIISTGYNGSPSGATHCIDKGCLIIDSHCKRVIHSEVNAITCCEISTKYSTLYVTHSPCLECFKVVHQAGVKRIVYLEEYRLADYKSLGINDNCMPEIVKIKIDSNNS